MKFTAVAYTFFAALLAFAVGTIDSCIQRDKRKAVTPENVVIPAKDNRLPDVFDVQRYQVDL